MIDATFSVCSVIQNAEHDRERVANSCPNLSEIPPTYVVGVHNYYIIKATKF